MDGLEEAPVLKMVLFAKDDSLLAIGETEQHMLACQQCIPSLQAVFDRTVFHLCHEQTKQQSGDVVLTQKRSQLYGQV
jgi:hypothetical protein